MKKPVRIERIVSLSNELHLLLAAIDGLRGIATVSLESDAPPRVALDQMDALLALVAERVRLFDRVVRGQLDPRLLWCKANDGVSVLEGEDVAFRSWSDARLLLHHEAAAENARRRLEHARSKKAGMPSRPRAT